MSFFFFLRIMFLVRNSFLSFTFRPMTPLSEFLYMCAGMDFVVWLFLAQCSGTACWRILSVAEGLCTSYTVRRLCGCGFVSGLHTVRWSLDLYANTTLSFIAIIYNYKVLIPSSVNSPTLLFFNLFYFLGLWNFHMNFSTAWQFLPKVNPAGIFVCGCIKFIDHLGRAGYL